MKRRISATLTLLFFIIALSASFGHEEEFCAGSPVSCASIGHTGIDLSPSQAANPCAADVDEYSATAATTFLLTRPVDFSSKTFSPRSTSTPSVEIEILPPVPIAA